MAEWAYLEHPETGGITRVPDDEGVIATQEARGWVRAEPPKAEPFVPAGGGLEPDQVAAKWVDLVHPDLPTAVNRVPNDPAAIQGAFEAGWQYPETPKDEDEPESKPANRNAKKAAAAPADDDKEG